MKKFLTAFIAVAAVTLGLCLTVSAEEFTEGFYTYTVENGEATITKITGESPDGNGDIVIPSELGGCPVTAIGDSACRIRGLSGDDPKDVCYVFPPTLKTIGEEAFYYNRNVIGITIQSDLESIGDRAFELVTPSTLTLTGEATAVSKLRGIIDFSYLQKVILGEKVTVIEDYAFSGCRGLKDLEIKGRLTYIGNEAFRYCSGLDGFEMPDTVEIIGDNIFDSTDICPDRLPSALKSVGNGVYANGDLGGQALPDTVEYIGDDAFYGCAGLENFVITDKITHIGEGAFQDCTSLTGIVDLGGIDEIPYRCFSGCSGIKGVVFSDTLTGIGGYAFSGCTGIDDIVVSDSVKSVSDTAFSGTRPVNLILGDGVKGVNGIVYDRVENVVFGRGITAIPKFSGSETLKTLTVKGDVRSIGSGSFQDCSALETVSFEQKLTAVNRYAFKGCSSLTGEIDLSEVEELWDGAFSGCSKLSSVKLNPSLTYIRPEVFENCTSARFDADFSNVTYVSARAFKGCDGLERELNFSAIEGIGEEAFAECRHITNVNMKTNGDVTIGSGAFIGCTGLTYLTLPDSVTSLGEQAFAFCTGLYTVYLPSKLTEIENGLFMGCVSLKNVDIPSTVTDIGYMAFANCPLTESVALPSSLVNISNMAYYGCTGVKTFTIKANSHYRVTKDVLYYNDGRGELLVLCPPGKTGNFVVPNSVAYIFPGAFATSSLSKLTVPATVLTVGDYAFADSGMTVYAYKNTAAEKYLTENSEEVDYFIMDGEHRGLILSNFAAGSAGISVSVLNDSERNMDCGTLYVAQIKDGRVLKVDSFDCGTVKKQDKARFSVTDVAPEADSAAAYLWNGEMRPLTEPVRALPAE